MIFYFSSTGNSRWAATETARLTGDKLVNIADAINGDCNYKLEEGENIGFVFPIHGWRVPLLIRAFFDKLRIDGRENHYTYIIVTAGDSVGKALDRMNEKLADKWHFDAMYSVIMPESYVGLPFMDVDKAENETKKKNEAKVRIEKIATDINAQRSSGNALPYGFDSLVRGPIPSFFSGPVGGFFEKILITDRPFHVNTAKCTKCGRCAKLCPVGDIDGGIGKSPVWLHNGRCLTCFSCYHHCPVRAIEYGKRTKNKGQYYFEKNK